MDRELWLPADVEAERAREEELARVAETVERRRTGPVADRLIRRDGRARKGAKTQRAYRQRFNRKRGGLKGIAGAGR